MAYPSTHMTTPSSGASPDWSALSGSMPKAANSGGGSDLDRALGDLTSSKDRNTDLAKMFNEEGQHLLQPLTEYLKAVTGGDRQALLQATMPERRRVIDQYATAKKAIAEFTPRGGGQAAAGAQLQADQAGDLANIGASARKEGFQQSGQVGMGLQGMGLQADAIASGDLNSLIQTLTAQEEAKANRWAQVGQAAGMIAAMYFTGGAAAPALAAAAAK